MFIVAKHSILDVARFVNLSLAFSDWENLICSRHCNLDSGTLPHYFIILTCFYSLWNSGAKYVDNKNAEVIPKFSSLPRQCVGKNKLPKAQQKPLYIILAMALACLGIFPKTMIWFFNSWDYLFYLNYIVYL